MVLPLATFNCEFISWTLNIIKSEVAIGPAVARTQSIRRRVTLARSRVRVRLGTSLFPVGARDQRLPAGPIATAY